MDPSEGDQLTVPSADHDQEVKGLRIGADGLKQREPTFIQPRRWQQIRVSVNDPVRECPYCYCLVTDVQAGRLHLRNVHKDDPLAVLRDWREHLSDVLEAVDPGPVQRGFRLGWRRARRVSKALDEHREGPI